MTAAARLAVAATLAGLWGCRAPVVVGAEAEGPPPRLLYSDLLSGPTTGGEGGQGVYLSLFGLHFGSERSAIRVHIGAAEVARVVSLGPSNGRPGVQQLTVQVGALDGAAQGVPAPITVEVAGRASSSSLSFTPQPGDFLFVDNVDGDDATAVKNDVQRPWRAVQTPDGGGALARANPGDVLVLRGKATWTDVGVDGRWVRFGPLGSAPTGGQRAGPLTLLAYPGETVRFVPRPGTAGGLHGASTGPAATWIVVAGLHLEGGGAAVSDGPVVLQVGSDHWRVVNNELGPWAGSAAARSGGIAGDGASVALLGNHVHDISGGTNNCIGLDDGATDVEVGWNLLEGCTSGSGVQAFSVSSLELERILVHHNLVRDTSRAGVLLGDGTRSARVWNNVIASSDGPAVRLQPAAGPVDLAVEHNTAFEPCRGTGQVLAAVVVTGGVTLGTARVANNVFVKGPGSRCADGYLATEPDSAARLSRNDWAGFTVPSTDAPGLAVEPGFVDAAGGDFHLLDGSPLIDAALDSSVVDDADGAAREGAADLGAFEWSSGGAGP